MKSMSVYAGESAYDATYPMAYLVTVACYGRHLHGHELGSVTRDSNTYGTLLQPPNFSRECENRYRRKESPYLLDSYRRAVTLKSIQTTCSLRTWTLLAAHVRTTHFHCVMSARQKPEVIVRSLKRYASRDLARIGLDGARTKRWVAGGSCRFLWLPVSVESATNYVVDEQGPPMHVFKAELWPESLA